MTQPSNFFQFEADFVESLRCIPMQVRLKLDSCGIKLKLPQWHAFSPEERQKLVELPCQSPVEVQDYREFLQQLVVERTGESASELPIDPAPEWENTGQIADSVVQKAEEIGVPLTLAQWVALAPEQRFALIKLSRSNHENRNFSPALEEFKLV